MSWRKTKTQSWDSTLPALRGTTARFERWARRDCLGRKLHASRASCSALRERDRPEANWTAGSASAYVCSFSFANACSRCNGKRESPQLGDPFNLQIRVEQKNINYNSRQRISRKRTLQPDHSEKSEARPGNGTLKETVEIKSKRIAARARSGTINYA